MVRMTERILCGLVLLVVAFSAHLAPAAELDAILQQAHPWGRFPRGAWRQVRIVTQSYDEQGKLTDTSITDNKTTVVEVTPERVTLEVEVTVEVAGQRFPSQPQIVKQGYAGETLGETASIKALEPQMIKIDGRDFRCETQQIDITGGVTKEVSVIAIAPDHQPAVLRRKSTMLDAGGTKTMQEVTSEVTSFGMGRRVLGGLELRPAYHVRQEQKNDRGTTITLSWHVPEVPGEVVEQCSKKMDETGRVVRQTDLELVGFGQAEVDETETQGTFPEPRRPTRRQKRRSR